MCYYLYIFPVRKPCSNIACDNGVCLQNGICECATGFKMVSNVCTAEQPLFDFVGVNGRVLQIKGFSNGIKSEEIVFNYPYDLSFTSIEYGDSKSLLYLIDLNSAVCILFIVYILYALLFLSHFCCAYSFFFFLFYSALFFLFLI